MTSSDKPLRRNRTIIATAERAEVEADRYQREECDARAWLGVDASWRDRCLFRWAYLRAGVRRSMARGVRDLEAIERRCNAEIVARTKEAVHGSR